MLFFLRSLLLLACGLVLAGCISNIWTGATLVYDRHDLYKKMGDFQLGANAGHALFDDKLFKRPDCSIDLAVFNGDILLAGFVPSEGLRKEAYKRIAALKGYRRIFNQLAVGHFPNTTLMDNWITAKIRSQIFADSSIAPQQFKIVTSQQVVYLMGDVIPAQAAGVIQMARTCEGVKRVVKLLKYYNLSNHPE